MKGVGRDGDASLGQVDDVIGGSDVKILKQSGQRHEADVLDQPVAHASPLARAEGNEILGLDDFALADESRRVESLRLVAPVVRTDVQLVIVQKDHCPFLDVVTFK